jgi:tRNA modification GTPase
MNTATLSTIVAPASALGGGVAVLRVSGELSGLVFRKLVAQPLITPRTAQFVTLRDPETGKILDKAVALYFQNPASFTGEDVLELHTHGGRAVVQRIMTAILKLDPSLRMAEGGEFTKRAYLNGKIDLTEAEAIADLIAAETEIQAEQATAQMTGALRDLYETWRTYMIRILAHLEATIDFVDEEDVPQDLLNQTREQLIFLQQELQTHLQDAQLGERLREGFVITLVGAPNAGKSSLLNALARRDIAIVSPIAGTTRDAIEAHLNIGGYPVIVIDTAGLRETSDTIETIGIARTKERAQQADIVLALFDATQPSDAETLSLCDDRTVLLRTKADLIEEEILHDPSLPLAVSVATQLNIDLLVKTIETRLHQLTARPKESLPLLTRARHREHVQEALSHAVRASTNDDIVLMAEDVRLAARAIGRLTGRVDVEDLLDVIFKDFCIGK